MVAVLRQRPPGATLSAKRARGWRRGPEALNRILGRFETLVIFFCFSFLIFLVSVQVTPITGLRTMSFCPPPLDKPRVSPLARSGNRVTRHAARDSFRGTRGGLLVPPAAWRGSV